MNADWKSVSELCGRPAGSKGGCITRSGADRGAQLSITRRAIVSARPLGRRQTTISAGGDHNWRRRPAGRLAGVRIQMPVGRPLYLRGRAQDEARGGGRSVVTSGRQKIDEQKGRPSRRRNHFGPHCSGAAPGAPLLSPIDWLGERAARSGPSGLLGRRPAAGHSAHPFYCPTRAARRPRAHKSGALSSPASKTKQTN
jgi:hypothetical protein